MRHPPPIAPATLLLALLAAPLGCGDDGVSRGSPVPAAEGAYLLVSSVSYDFQSASFGRIDLADRQPWPDLGSVHSDSSLRWTNGFLFVVNRRGADNLQRLNPATQATLWQYSTGTGSNPQDIVAVSAHRAYVTLYDTADLLVVDPDPASEAGFVLDRIDLSALADSDGIPEAGPVALVGETVFVALQRLDRGDGFLPSNPSYLVAFDGATGQPVDLAPGDAATVAFELPVANPFIAEAMGPELWIGCVGRFGEADGAILRWLLPAGELGDPVVTEAALGGDLSALAAGDPAYVVWTDFSLQSHVSVVDGSGGPPSILVSDLGSVEDLVVDGGFVYVPDRSRESPGIRIFDQGTGVEVTGEPLSMGLPPWHLERVPAPR